MSDPGMTDEEWKTLHDAADVLERCGYHRESVVLVKICQDNRQIR
jgi:hypothetical protein